MVCGIHAESNHRESVRAHLATTAAEAQRECKLAHLATIRAAEAPWELMKALLVTMAAGHHWNL